MPTAPATQALEAESDRIARAVLATLDRYARGEDGPEIDAEYEALFWEGERVAEALAAASAVECAA